MRGAIAGAVVALCAAVAAWWLWPTGESAGETPPPQERRRIKEVTPVAAPATAVAPGATDGDASAGERPLTKEEKAKIVKVLSVTTNATGYVIEITRDGNGKETLHVHEPKSPWEFFTDRIIAMALMTKEGQALPPFPPMSADEDEVFLESLKKPITVDPDDSEETKAMKKLVSYAREGVKERMDRGELFMDIMNDHRNLLNENGMILGKAHREYGEILASGDLEGAHQYALRIGAALQQMGITSFEADKEAEAEYEAERKRKENAK